MRTTGDVGLDSSSSTAGPISDDRGEDRARLEDPQRERPRPAPLLGLDEHRVLPGPELDRHPVLVEREGAGPAALVDELAVDPHADAVVAADGEERRAGRGPLHERVGVRRPRVGRGEPQGLVDAERVAPGGGLLPAHDRAVGALQLGVHPALQGRLASLARQRVAVQRLREWPRDEPGLDEPPVAPGPGQAGLVLGPGGRGRRRRRLGRRRQGRGENGQCERDGTEAQASHGALLPCLQSTEPIAPGVGRPRAVRFMRRGG